MKDLRTFIEDCERMGELRRYEDVSWNLEIGTISELMSERHGPALLFDRIPGYGEGMRVFSNVIEEPNRAAASCALPYPTTASGLVRNLKDRLARYQPVKPHEVNDGPVLENKMREGEVDMLSFPAPLWHEKDGGRYIGTGCVVITRDPDDDWVNLGTYRIQVHDRDTLGVFIGSGHHGSLIRKKFWDRGKSCPVAISLGHHPSLLVASFLQRPWKESEYEVAGFLAGEPVPVIQSPLTGLPIPASSEILVEGEIPPPDVLSHEEGPFGEWPGYYASGMRKEPVVKVKSVMFRSNPIILGAAPLKPPSTHGVHFFRAAAVWEELDRTGVPGVRSVFRQPAGGTKFLTVISIKQMYPGHAKHVATAATGGSEGGYSSRYVVIVDDDIDPSRLEDVVWAICTRCEPGEAIDIIKGCWTAPVDPLVSPEKRERRDFTTARAIFYACKPYNWMNEFPLVSRASDQLRAEVAKKWMIE